MPNWKTLVSPCLDPASHCSISSSPSDRESVYGETPVCGLSSWTTSPFCSLSVCSSPIVLDFADFSPMAELNFMWNDIDGKSFSSLVKSCSDEVLTGEGMFSRFPVERLVLPLYVNKPSYFKHTQTPLLLNLLLYMLL